MLGFPSLNSREKQPGNGDKDREGEKCVLERVIEHCGGKVCHSCHCLYH